MNIVFCLFKYFPYGGLQRDFLRIAKLCQSRGHKVIVYTMEWQGEQPENMDINLISCKKLSNHDKALYFSNKVKQQLNKLEKTSQNKTDLVIGFNKMPGLDIYYCADSCYVAKVDEQKSKFINIFYKITKRYRAYKDLEEQVFLNNNIKKLYLSDNEQNIYINKYRSTNNFLLPPNIDKERFTPVNDFHQKYKIKKELAKELGLDINTDWLLMVGSGFKTKGVDRSIELIKFLKQKGLKTHLIIIGQDNAKAFNKQIQNLGLNSNIKFLSGRDDIARFMAVATLLLHPAYRENTGTVILEAIIMGLPVVASGICGYAKYITQSGCGEVIAEPFEQRKFEQVVYDIILNNKNIEQGNKGLMFRDTADIYSADDKIIDIIENY